MKHQFLLKLTKKMNGKLPGRISHEIMMVKPRYKSIEIKTYTPAAVLILLYPIKDKWHFFLTKRTNNVEHHKGQISLPGGMLEKGESHKEAAIRECLEETGCSIKKITPMLEYFPAPGSSESFYYLFLGEVDAPNETRIKGLETENEDIFVKSYKIDDVKNKMDNREFLNGLTILALQWFFLNIEKKN